MNLLDDQSAAVMTEYALLTLVTVGILAVILRTSSANIYGQYLDKVINAFMIRPRGGLSDLASELAKIGRY